MFNDDDLLNWNKRKRFPFFSIMPKDIEQYFYEMDKYFEEILKDVETKIPKDLIKERDLPDGNKSREIGPFVYGYSVTVGPDGKPVIREFGNIKPGTHGEKPIEFRDQREPLVDVFNETDIVKVIAELPGVEKKDINLNIEGKSLIISVETPKKFYKKIELPENVDYSTPNANYLNGILEVILNKPKIKKQANKKIEIN